MKVLLDDNLPHLLRLELPGHDVYTVAYMNWSGVQNGELLRRAAADGFDVLVTNDRGLEYQQNVQFAARCRHRPACDGEYDRSDSPALSPASDRAFGNPTRRICEARVAVALGQRADLGPTVGYTNGQNHSG
jgi:hypothetical protein